MGGYSIVLVSCMLLCGSGCASGPNLVQTGEVRTTVVSRDRVYPTRPIVRRQGDEVTVTGRLWVNRYAHYGRKPLNIEFLDPEGQQLASAHVHWNFAPTTRRPSNSPSGRYEVKLRCPLRPRSTVRVTPLRPSEDVALHNS